MWFVPCYKVVWSLDQGLEASILSEDQIWKKVLQGNKVDGMQFGFTPGKGTTDTIFILR